MKNILLAFSLLFFNISFSQVITFECNNTIVAVTWEEIVNNPNADMDWDDDGDIDEDDALIYLYDAYDCENPLGVDCEEYVTIVYDCSPDCLDNQEMNFWEEINESNCEIYQMCGCVDINNNFNWNDIDWIDSDWEEFDWEIAWSDYDLGNVVDWNDIPWGDIIDLDINPEDLINYIQNMLLGQSFNWDTFVGMQGGEDCIDDPDGILESYSYQCNDIVGDWFSWDCDDDLSVAFPGAPLGMWIISDLCPQSCTDCEQEEECVAQLIPDCMFMTVIDPVCGCDGVTYSNSGEAACNNIFDFTIGECETIFNGCTLSDGSIVPNGWSGNDVEDNWCNSCFCEDGELSCTEIDCGGDDCVDDPFGLLIEDGGITCNELLILYSCETDISQFDDGIPTGLTITDICPLSCNACEDGIEGCMDMEACNYNEEATIDNGSCDYGVQCLVSPCSTTPSPYPGASCIDDYCEGCCAVWTWSNQDGEFSFNTCEDEYIEGCTDFYAANYDSEAILDDGSCEYAWDNCADLQWLETFDDYQLGNIDSQTTDWIGWDNTNSLVDVVDFSMNNSLVDGQSILVEQDDDIIHLFDPIINAGQGEVSFHMYIPSTDNAGAYYNMLHESAAANSNWAFQVLFASASSGEQSFIDLGDPVYFDAIYDSWIEVRHDIDIDNDLISLYYNSQLITSWEWSGGSTGISSVLDALNLYGFCAGENCTGMAYYDNIELCGNFYDNSYIDDNIDVHKKLVKITDILGRDVKGEHKNKVLLYIYDDGSLLKKYILDKK